MINENELAKELQATLSHPIDPPKMPRLSAVGSPLTPKGILQAVENATNEDTTRASRMMKETTEKIIASLEKEIAEATEVRDTITKRIEDLNFSLGVAKASLQTLSRNPSGNQRAR